MKKLFSIVICVMALLFASCEPNDPATSSKVETGAASDITPTSAVLHGVVNVDISQYDDVEFGMMISKVKDDLNNLDGEKYEAKVLIGKEFKLELKKLSPETEYYYCAWVLLNDMQYEFGDIKTFTTQTYPAGSFSVSKKTKIVFSTGNLQYHPQNKQWRFAKNQTDYIGDANSNISDIYNGWIDLFGWGTGDYPTNISEDSQDYSKFVDWGSNKIGKEGPNTWRTLTMWEWEYLLYERSNAESLSGTAQVNGVNGLILLPDSWVSPQGLNFIPGGDRRGNATYESHNSYSIEDWKMMERKGAIFLPSAGCRTYDKRVILVQEKGYYWTPTLDFVADPEFLSIDVHFGGSFNEGSFQREMGRSVRLVKDVE